MKRQILIVAALLLAFVSCSEKQSKGEEYASSEEALKTVALVSGKLTWIMESEIQDACSEILKEMNAHIRFESGLEDYEAVLVVIDSTFNEDNAQVLSRNPYNPDVVVLESDRTEFEYFKDGFDINKPKKDFRSPRKWPKDFYEKAEELFPVLNEIITLMTEKPIGYYKYITMEECKHHPERSSSDIDVYVVLYKMNIPRNNFHRYYGYEIYMTRDGEIQMKNINEGESLLDIFEH